MSTPTPGGHSYQDRPDYETNHLSQIDGLHQEVITDKTLSYHDSMFKLIIIGDSGNSHYDHDHQLHRHWKILCVEETS